MTEVAWADARRIAFGSAAALPAQQRQLTDALGCVAAEAMWSLSPLPAFDTAAMDGWAVRGRGPWRVLGRVSAGEAVGPALQDGTAVEIATGAQVPPGADAVLPLEEGAILDAELTGDAEPGRHIRRTGEECAARTPLLPAGAVLSPAALGLLAAVGHDRIRVHPRPRVHALVTGNELVRSGLPGNGQVRDAVGPLLPGVVASYGGELVALDHLGDDPELLRKAIDDADADVVVTTGASSVGRADFLPTVLREMGARLLVAGVRVKPGHPQQLAELADGRLLVGLPGNPLAALAGAATVLAPVLAGLAGRSAPRTSTARLVDALPAVPAATRLVPVAVRDALARPTGHAGAAMLRGAAVADAFAVVPPGTHLSSGDAVELLALP